MINKDNGELKIGNTHLHPNLNRVDFLTLPLAQEIIGKREGEYPSFLLKPQPVGEIYFNMAIYFGQDDKLLKLSLRICHDGQVRTWENWAEEKEQRLKGEHDSWLYNVLGKPHRFGSHGETIYEYKWGEVVSAYDPRSSASNLTIRYY